MYIVASFVFLCAAKPFRGRKFKENVFRSPVLQQRFNFYCVKSLNINNIDFTSIDIRGGIAFFVVVVVVQ